MPPPDERTPLRRPPPSGGASSDPAGRARRRSDAVALTAAGLCVLCVLTLRPGAPPAADALADPGDRDPEVGGRPLPAKPRATGAGGWVDEMTPHGRRTRRSLFDGTPHELVFSDEFETDGRTFADGDDPRWTALEKNDYTNDALHYYAADAASTRGGRLRIKTSARNTAFSGFDDASGKDKRGVKKFRSAMLQGWNKFCFTGGIVETELELPGAADVGGLWPAFWLLGNLARHTFVGSSNNMWPWSQSTCPAGTSPAHPLNKAQAVSGCNGIARYGMAAYQVRAAAARVLRTTSAALTASSRAGTVVLSPASPPPPLSHAPRAAAPRRSIWSRPSRARSRAARSSS